MLACGRLHFNALDEAQVRYMAVDENKRGRGYWSCILRGLEAEAARRGARKVVLNARDDVTESMPGTVMRSLTSPKCYLE